MKTAQELLELERAGWDSLCGGTGADFYGRLMTDDALMVLANGAVMDRDGVIAALSDAPPWDDYDIANVRTIDVSNDVVALVYTGTGRRNDFTFVGLMSSTYVRHGSTWKLALYQQTERR